MLQDNLAKADKPAATTQLKKNISKVKDLRGQFLRAEKMSNYTEELLCMDPPFVQRKFRVKVSRDTPTDEIESYQDEAIQRAKMESTRMKIRMKRWDEEIANLNSEIQIALSDPAIDNKDRAKYENWLKKDEDINQRKCKTAVRRIQKEIQCELQSSRTQFLLKYTEDKLLDPRREKIDGHLKHRGRAHHRTDFVPKT